MNYHLNYRVVPSLFAIMALSFFGFLGAFSYPNSASAVTITPTRFEITGNPGETLDQEMLIINETEKTETYYSSFSNFEAQGESGSPAFVEPKDGLGTWISTSASVSVAPGQQKAVPFKITIPKDAEPGGHFAVIFWGDSPNAGTGQVAIGSKTGVLVLLSVNGEVKESAGLLNFNTVDKIFWYKTLPVSFEYRFKNDGGDRVKPAGKITIRNSIFLPTEKLDANPTEGNVLPGSTRKIKVDWLNYERSVDYVAPGSVFKKFWSDVEYEWKNFALGLYSANLNVAYGASGEEVKKTAFFFVFPWQLVIVILIILIIVFWGGKNLIRRYNRLIIEKARAGTGIPPESSHG